MGTEYDDLIEIALGSIGIYFSTLKINECYNLITKYLKKKNSEFPVFDPVCSLSVICNSLSYSFKAMLYSQDEYAIASHTNYSIFKVLRKEKYFYNIFWKSNLFNVSIAEKNNNFQVKINQNYTVDIRILENSTENYSEFPFKVDDTFSNETLNSIFDKCLSKLNNILKGYVLPEPMFSSNLNNELELLFNILRDPLLPSLQFQSLLDNNSTIPANLLNELHQVIAQYTSNCSSVFSRFPSTKILSLVNRFLDSIGDQNTKYNMGSILRPIMELSEMFSCGIRGNAKYVIESILDEYRKVEVKFQNEEDIMNVNTINQPIAVSDVFSHNCLTEKNKLILYLIDHLEKYLPGLIVDLKATIIKLLNSLNGRIYSQVISKLREILITGQIPSYEIRKNEIESIFLNSSNQYSNSLSTGRLESLIYSNTEMFDIISDFFYHKTMDFRKCALEVYIRRAYMAYDIKSFKQSQLSSGHLCVIFQFSRSSSTFTKRKRSNSFVTFNNNYRQQSINNRKHFQYHPVFDKITRFYLDKDDTSEVFCPELLNEYNVMDDKQNDNDTDSAISIGGLSLSETSATVSDQVEFDSISEKLVNQCQPSPSTRSLEEISAPHKTSNTSLDSLFLYKCKRHFSIFPNQIAQHEDFINSADTGIMVIFNTIEEFDRHITCLIDFLEIFYQNDYLENDYLENDYLENRNNLLSKNKIAVNIALCDQELIVKSDDNVAQILYKFCLKISSYLCENNVSRITFLLQSMDKSLRYFTFRKNNNFEEDIKVRQIDPALSFQLEINRLQNYHLERLPVLNRRMYVYLGKHKEKTHTNSEYRMFVRCIIHHNDINSSTTNIEFMAKEAEKSLLEAMDAIDIAQTDRRSSLTSANHIFFYFNAILCLNQMDVLESVVRNIVLKYGRRLWNLRITQAELKLLVKLGHDFQTIIPIRLWVHNEGGKSLDIFIYREEFVDDRDRKCLITWSSVKGRYHGLPVDCFYSI